MSTYCDVAPTHEWHGPYHANEYGFPLASDADLFERLILEINQAGLSWLTILKKREAFRKAYDEFDPEIVARYKARDRKRLLTDPGIIRNRLKVDAAIANAQKILELRKSHGGFHAWLKAHHPVTDSPASDANTQLLDLTGVLHARDVGWPPRWSRIASPPLVHVGTVETGCPHPHSDLSRLGLGSRNLPELDDVGVAGGGVDDGFHRGIKWCRKP